MKEITINDFDGFMYCSNVKIQVTDSEFKKMYINDYGVAFIKHDGILYMRSGRYCDSFERVRSEQQIDMAFNPDRFEFEEWRRSYGR